MISKLCKKKSRQQKELEKNIDYYQLLSHWLEIKNIGGSVAEYFQDLHYKRIAVYGMGDLASRLAEDLLNSEIEIIYGIDQDACRNIPLIQEVYSFQEEWEKVDVIVVTPFFAYRSICEQLQKKIDCPIVSIEEVIWSV